MNKISNLIILILMLGITGCSDSPDTDVVEFVSRTKKKESKLQELPKFKKPIPYFYEGRNKRDPFSSKVATLRNIGRSEVRANYAGPIPDFKRRREILEEYSLESLTMVGVIAKNGRYWGLIKDSSGIVHRVGVGNYIGQNYGKIADINEVAITVNELVPDEEGGWRERKNILRLE